MSTKRRVGRIGRWSWAIGCAIAAAIVGPAHAGDEKKSSDTNLQVKIDDEDGTSIRVDLAGGWLGALVDSVDLACETHDTDEKARAMMKSLQEQGEGGVYRFTDPDDRDEVVARRSRGALKIEVTQPDGDLSRIEMPWEIAECLMLGVEPPGDLGRRVAKGEAKLRLDLRDDGSRIRLSLD